MSLKDPNPVSKSHPRRVAIVLSNPPWRIEDELKKLGANYIQAGLWRGFAIRDGNLITGQQNFSGEETARLLLDTLGR